MDPPGLKAALEEGKTGFAPVNPPFHWQELPVARVWDQPDSNQTSQWSRLVAKADVTRVRLHQLLVKTLSDDKNGPAGLSK